MEGASSSSSTSSSPSPRSGGLVLGSVGRDLSFEAILVEKLGRLVCEGALIEVIDVHKEVGASALRGEQEALLLTPLVCFTTNRSAEALH